MALAHGKSYQTLYDLRHDCRICRQNADQRKLWGCERATREEQLFVPCACGGFATRCRLCNGSGYEPIRRCPRASLGAEVAEYLVLHRVWPTALPRGGGLDDQEAAYVQAMRLLDYAFNRLGSEISKAREAAEKWRQLRNLPSSSE